MAFPTSSALCLLGILICGSFLEAEASTCAIGWFEGHGNCYAYFDEKLSWAEAEMKCQNYGPETHLASVLTQAETNFLSTQIYPYQKHESNVWSGLHFDHQNQMWRWSDGSTYNYKVWEQSQPDNYHNSEYCAELLLRSGFKEWNDQNCQTGDAYVCKHKL